MLETFAHRSFGVLWIFACSDSYGSPKQLPFFEIKPLKWHLCAENERRVRSAPACGLLETPAGYEPKELGGCVNGYEKKAGN